MDSSNSSDEEATPLIGIVVASEKDKRQQICGLGIIASSIRAQAFFRNYLFECTQTLVIKTRVLLYFTRQLLRGKFLNSGP